MRLPRLALIAWLLLPLAAGCGSKSDAPVDDAGAKHARSEVERGPVRLTAEVRPVRPRLSDLPTLTLTIDHEEGVKVEKPLFGTMIGKFTIRDMREPLPKTDNGREIVQQVYTLEPAEPGRLRIDPIAVSFSDQRTDANAAEQTIETEPLSIDVSSVLGDKTPALGDLHPPAAPITLPAGVPAWVWAIVLVVIVLFAAFFRRRRRETPRKMAAVKILTAEEIANMELDKLIASGLAASDIKQFYIELTAIIRRYIERTTGIRAPERTTEEFLREVTRMKTFELEVRARLRDFLEAADLVKFAAHRPKAEDVDESVCKARLFIASRTPALPPVDVAASAGQNLEATQAS